MVDTSVLFSFSKVDNFFELLIDSNYINTSMMDGHTQNFRIVLAEQCNDNIEDNLLANGTLNENEVTVIGGATDGKCALLWNRGVNSNRAITMGESAVNYTFDDDESHMLKGAFLITENEGIVLAYSINSAPIPLGGSFSAPVDGMIWSIKNQIYEG